VRTGDRQRLGLGRTVCELGFYRLRFHSRLRPTAGRPERVPQRTERSIGPRRALARATTSLMDEAGNRVVLRPDRVTRVGRADDNDVILADERSSRYHAAITRANGRFVIRDVRSPNGTLVGEVRVMEQGLPDGDHVRLGDTRFTFLRRISWRLDSLEVSTGHSRLLKCPEAVARGANL
jgi:pSer/pThr/pTyr-binding forkhead associated (FHA) protein